MRYYLLPTFCFLFSGWNAQAQLVPPPDKVTGTLTTCDQTPWRLVFHDDFNGPLDREHWNTFNAWYRMEPNDNDNWEGGRAKMVRVKDSVKTREIILDKNVVLEGGWAKLKAYKEAASWNCTSCTTPTKHSAITSAELDLNFRHYPLDHGKIEVRATMPTFDYGHHAIWLWYGVHCINEIDLIEAYGKRNSYSARNVYATYNTHEWNNVTQECNENSVRIRDKRSGEPQHVDGSLIKIGGHEQTFMRAVYRNNRFQRPANWYNTTYRPEQIFDMEEPHLYGVAFDEHQVLFYLDNMLLAQVPKYYQKINGRKVIPECTSTGTFYMNNGFPWDPAAKMQFRMGVGVHGSLYYEPETIQQLPDGFLGEMKIDYVTIAQRTESDYWQFIDSPRTMHLLKGTGYLFDDQPQTYYTNQSSEQGKWLFSDHFEVLFQDKDSIILRPNQALFTNGMIAYQLSKEADPVRLSVHKNIEPIAPAQLKLTQLKIGDQAEYLLYVATDYPELPNQECKRVQYKWHVQYWKDDNTKEQIELVGNYSHLPKHWNLLTGKVKIQLTATFPLEQVVQHVHVAIGNKDSPHTIAIEEMTIAPDVWQPLWDIASGSLLYYPYEVVQEKYIQEQEGAAKIELAAAILASEGI